MYLYFILMPMKYEQSHFFNIVRAVAPANQNIAQNIADILDISINEAYKKMRGKSALNFNQLIQLCDEFNIPFSYQPDGSDSIIFSQPKSSKGSPDMLLYLHDLLKNLQLVSNLKKSHLYITTDDIPLFHFFKYPELTCFKLFFWANNTEGLNGKFDSSCLRQDIIDVASRINELYLQIPSTEIWSKDTVHGTIEQIRYAVEAGYLPDRELTVKILEQLRLCIVEINSYAVNSRKTKDPEHSFNWYCCDVLGSISYLVESKEMTACYNRFNTFSYLKTDNADYCSQTKQWMNGLVRKSVSFSGHGEKHRNKYINNSSSEIDIMIAEVAKNTWF